MESRIIAGKYVLLEVAAGGGMSVLYLAKDLRLGKAWAVKETRKNYGEGSGSARVQGIRTEARLLSRLDHPGLPHVVDFYETEEALYIVMDYIQGSTLESLVRACLEEEGGRPAGENACRLLSLCPQWMLELCKVMEYLHGKGVLHQDLKPSNIMIRRDGRLFLLDFGAAAEIGKDGGVKQEKSGTGEDGVRSGKIIRKMGTPGFAAPEQMQPEGKADQRTDIYGFGRLWLYVYQELGKAANQEKEITKWETLLQSCVRETPNERLGSFRQLEKEILRMCKETVAPDRGAVQPDKEIAAPGNGSIQLENQAGRARQRQGWKPLRKRGRRLSRGQDKELSKGQGQFAKGQEESSSRKKRAYGGRSRKGRAAAALSAVCILVLLGAGNACWSSFQVKQDLLDMERTIDPVKKAGYLEHAISVKPEEVDLWDQLFGIIKEDGAFSEEEQALLTRMAQQYGSRLEKGQEGWIEFSIGCLYWFYLPEEQPMGSIQARPWFEEAAQDAGVGSSLAEEAALYASLGSFYQEIAMDVAEGKESGRYLDCFEGLQDLLGQLEERDSSPLLHLEICRICLYSVENYASGMERDGISKEEIEAFLDRVLELAEKEPYDSEKARSCRTQILEEEGLAREAVERVYEGRNPYAEEMQVEPGNDGTVPASGRQPPDGTGK